MANEYSRYPDNLDILGADGSLPEVPDKLSSFEPVALLSDNISPQTRDIPFTGVNPNRIPKQGIVRIDDEIIAYKRIRVNEGSNSGDLQLSTSTERGLAGTSGHTRWTSISTCLPTPHRQARMPML